MGEGVIGIVGTAVGGLLGVVGTVLAARLAGRDQRRSQYEQWRREVRRDAYGAFILELSKAYKIGRTAHYSGKAGSPEAPGLIADMEAAAGALDSAAVLVALEGPEHVAEAATSLWSTFVDWQGAVEGAHATDTGSSPLVMSWSYADEYYDMVALGQDEFASLCRALLDHPVAPTST